MLPKGALVARLPSALVTPVLPPPAAGLSVQESEGNRHWGAPEPSRPSHSSTARAENSLDTDIWSSAGSPHPPVLSAAVTVLLHNPHPRSPPTRDCIEQPAPMEQILGPALVMGSPGCSITKVTFYRFVLCRKCASLPRWCHE